MQRSIFLRSSLLFSLLSLSSCDSPHVVKSGLFDARPEDGYVWANPNSFFSYDVVWKPGSRNPNWPHVHASEQPGWSLDDGYNWDDSNNQSSLAAHWQDNVQSTAYPHIVSAREEGTWSPAPGYSFTNAPPSYPDRVAVAWSPNSAWASHPHIHAAQQEGRWTADDGYEFIDPSKGLEVRSIQNYASSSNDDTGQHVANAIGLGIVCPTADENSWTITKIISAACAEKRRQEIDAAARGIFRN